MTHSKLMFNAVVLIAFLSFSLIGCKQDTGKDQAANTPKVETTQPAAQKVVQQTAQKPAPQQNKYAPTVPGGKINWMTFEEAEKAIKKNPKKVFVDVYTDWCGWCKRLDQATFSDKRVADLMNDEFYAIKFDAQHPDPITLGGKEFANPNFDPKQPKRARNATHQLAQKYRAQSYPTVLFLNHKMELVQALPGFRTADQFLPILQQIAQK